MLKQILGLGIILVFASFVYAQESLTITTYYPSPYGSYKELTAQRMKIGTTYSGAGTSVSDNNLIVEGSLGIGTASPGSYGGQQSKLDAAGYVAANDVWLKDVGRWASQGTTSPACTFCLSCGGQWPSYQGSFSTDDDSWKNPEVARGSNCSGTLQQNPSVGVPISLCCR